MSGPGFIAPQLDEVCEECGRVDECRPYGANDENICFDCDMKDEESKAIAERKMSAYIFGEKE